MSLSEKDFEQIRQLYFPRWDKARRWGFRVELAPGMVRGSYCDSHNRTIYIAPDDATHHSARMVLVHEITHAVTTVHHGKRFQQRMLAAAERADQLSDAKLAELLRQDVEAARKSEDISETRYVYGTICDWVFQGDRELSFEDVRASMAYDCGYTVERFDSSYPRARKVFDGAMRDRAREAKWRKQALSMMERQQEGGG